MINFANDAELSPDALPEGSDRGQREVDEAIQSVQGILADRAKSTVPQAAESSSHHAALERVRAPLAPGQQFKAQEQAPTQPEQNQPRQPFSPNATSTAEAVGAKSHVYGDLEKDVKTAGKTGLAFAGGAAAINGGITAASAAALNLSPAAIAGLTGVAGLTAGVQAGAAGLALYGGGMLHKLVWKTPPEKSGFWNTMGRGIISGVSVPVGLIWKNTFGREKKAA